MNKPEARNVNIKWGKELNFCHKLNFSNPYIFATRCRRPLIYEINERIAKIKDLKNLSLLRKLSMQDLYPLFNSTD